jgi:hypothetical protein
MIVKTRFFLPLLNIPNSKTFVSEKEFTHPRYSAGIVEHFIGARNEKE